MSDGRACPLTTRRPTRSLAPALLTALLVTPALAGEVAIVDARARCGPERVCSVQVTLRHADTGWDHYANRWEVLAPDGTLLATRVLRHPHVDEQPFTRGLRAVRVPAEVSLLRIRAYDSLHGAGPEEFTIRLAPASAPGERP